MHLQGVEGPEYFDLMRSWPACAGTNKGRVRAAQIQAASGEEATAFTGLAVEDQRLLVKACFEVATEKFSRQFELKHGYAQFAAALGEENFWPRAAQPPVAAGSGPQDSSEPYLSATGEHLA